ncbi:MAG: SET domain-containing protein [Bacteroidota bacterium]
MALLESQLRIKRSRIPSAGKGLFTTRPIKKSQRILEYKGRLRLWREAKHEDSTNTYLLRVSRTHVIDARRTLSSLGRYANDARGISRIEGLKNNAEYVTDGNRCFMEATRSIPAGSEIFVGYGREFWLVHGKK